MTAAQMISLFDLYQDKNSEAYFTAAEQYLFLNKAQSDLFNKLIGVTDLKEPVMAQIDERAGRLLEPFIGLATAVSDSSGLITYAAIETDLFPATTEQIVAVLDVMLIDGADRWSAQYRKPQEFQAAKNNEFTAGSAANNIANYTVLATGIDVDPTGQTWDVRALRLPLDISGSQDCEFPVTAHRKIVMMALRDAEIITEVEAAGILNEVTL